MRGRDPEMALRVAGPGVEIVLRSAFPGLLRHPQRSHAPGNGPAVLWRVFWCAARRQPELYSRHGYTQRLNCMGVSVAGRWLRRFGHARDRRRTGVLRRERRHVYGAGLQNRNAHLAFRNWPGLAGFTDDLYGRRHTICGSCRTRRNIQFCSDAVEGEACLAPTRCGVGAGRPRGRPAALAALPRIVGRVGDGLFLVRL
jgi:hypothetical protein